MLKRPYESLPLLAFVALLSVAITAAIQMKLSHGCKPNRVTAHIAQVTESRAESLRSETQRMKNHIEQYGTPDILSFDFDRNGLNDVSLFLTQNEKIIFWTDNAVPWYGDLPNELPEDVLVMELQNGWYQVHVTSFLGYQIVGFSLIKNRFPYQNEYLSNLFHPDYQIQINPEISVTKGKMHNVFNHNGQFLFHLDYDRAASPDGKQNIPLLLFALLSFILINLLLLRVHIILNPFKKYPNLAIAAFAVDAMIVRGLIGYFRFPEGVHNLELFGPQIYASSWINPSLGDLTINILVLSLIAWACFKYGRFQQIKSNVPLRETLTATLLIISIALIAGFTFVINSIIFDSTLTFNFGQLLSVDTYSIIALILIVVLSLSLLMMLDVIFRYALIHKPDIRNQLILGIALLMLLLIRAVQTNDIRAWITAAVFAGFMTSYALLKVRLFKNLTHTVLLFTLLSASLTWMINTYSLQKEQNYRLLVASDYAQKEDPLAEFKFGKALEQISNDSLLTAMVFHDQATEEAVINYILKEHFQAGEHFWAKYHFQVTFCTPAHQLVVEHANELVECYAFFEQQIQELGSTTMVPDLIFIQDYLGQSNYLGILHFTENTQSNSVDDKVRIYIELFPKIVPVDVGYLELLVDQSVKEKAGLAKYTNARYKNGQLVASYGKYNYSIGLKKYGEHPQNHYFFSKGGYSHLFYRTGPDTVLLISKPEDGVLNTIAPFSIFLLVFLFLYGLRNLLQNNWLKKNRVQSNFKLRLQLALFSVILLSFVVVGGTAVYYISTLNHNKNMDNLREKARSIRIEVEHKLADKEILNDEIRPYIQQILAKFNDVFATDINLFDTEGNLLGSSRPLIFEEGLINQKMNTIAYREMVVHQKTLLIHEEQIGKLNYLSAYIPFKNNRGNIIAYINLPYFARQTELTDEISSFLMAFINIYLLLIAITVLYAFLISDMIAKPLILIREKIRRMKLGEVNEKISWEGHDEIGELVFEYNRMIDELALSADLLAKSERESAWREMARQVAHEIKNPLTPMKLNLQHLERSLNDDPVLWKRQFSKFSKVMHEQIESLTTIASAFSDFANMPRGTKKPIALSKALQTVLALYSGYPDVTWDVEIKTSETDLVFCAPEQLNRMIINFLNNALQAGVKGRKLRIGVEATKVEDTYRLSIRDNGKGISSEIQDKIFLPNFTTKTSGMGLGLAISQSIAESMGGAIQYITEIDRGTTFIITLPVHTP